jgi:hypothetical protein
MAAARPIACAIDGVPADATAYAHRGRHVMATVGVIYQDQD